MEVTKHDLSYNHVKLDLSAMLDVAKHAYYSDLNRISVQVTDMLRKPYEEEDTCKSTISCYHGASNLQGLSKSLRVAAETYHALLGLKDREEVEFVNKPDCDDYDDSDLTCLDDILEEDNPNEE